jgi:hypothetical protein|tara:strand:+ start:309 stop:482 length:174 start_codon:yes stop_codon:yes gene_type:complete
MIKMSLVKKQLSDLEYNVEQAIALLEENIKDVPAHGCKRDEVLAILKSNTRFSEEVE